MTELEALARAATPGPWETRGASVHSVATGYIMEGKSTGYIGSLSSPRGPEQRDADCAFIAAANPTAILALLSELDTLSAKNKALAERVAVLEGQLADADVLVALVDGNERAIMRLTPPWPITAFVETIAAWRDVDHRREVTFRRARTLITGADHAKG